MIYEPDKHPMDVLSPERYEQLGDVLAVVGSFVGWSAIWCYFHSSAATRRRRKRDQVPLLVRLGAPFPKRPKESAP